MTIGLSTTGRSWNWGRKRELPEGVRYHRSVQHFKSKGYVPRAKTRDTRGVLRRICDTLVTTWGAMWGMLGVARGARDDEGHAGNDERRTVRQEV